MLTASTCKEHEIVSVMVAALKAKATGGEQFDLVAAMRGCRFAKVTTQHHEIVGGVVFREEDPCLWVVAAAGQGMPEEDMSVAIDEYLHAIAGGFSEIGFRTRRRGLIQKAIARGYAIAGDDGEFTIMKKATR